jgi:hypothetical protein
MNIAASGRPLQHSPHAFKRFTGESWNLALQNSAFTCVAVRACNASIFASATFLINGRGVPVRSVRPYPRGLSAIFPRSPLSHFLLSHALSVCPLFRRLVACRHPEGQRFLWGQRISLRSSSLQLCHFVSPFLSALIGGFSRHQKQLWGRPVASGRPHNPV